MPRAASWNHPLRAWRLSQRWSRETLATLLQGLGRQAKARTLEAIENGFRRPSFELCEAIETLSGGKLCARDLRKHPLRDEAAQDEAA
jgi:transcriptional regulator with XRE-family HTH domain